MQYPSFAISQAVAIDKFATISHGTISEILLLSPKTVLNIPFPAPAMKATPPFWTFSTHPGNGSSNVPKTKQTKINF